MCEVRELQSTTTAHNVTDSLCAWSAVPPVEENFHADMLLQMYPVGKLAELTYVFNGM